MSIRKTRRRSLRAREREEFLRELEKIRRRQFSGPDPESEIQNPLESTIQDPEFDKNR